MNPEELLQKLMELQTLEFDESELDEAKEKEVVKKIEELRLQIPLPILNHYDRLRVRGKKGVVPVRNQTCSGCHVQVTRALVINLKVGEDIQVCENCGRYLFLPPAKEAESPAKQPADKQSKKSSKELACAA